MRMQAPVDDHSENSLTGFLCRLQIQSVVEKVAAADVSNASPGRTVCQQKGSDRKAASGKMQSETLPTKVSRRCGFWLQCMIVNL